MPVIQQEVVVTANTTNENILQNSLYEIIPFPARIEIGLSATATGLLIDCYSGLDTVAEQFRPPENNRVPVYPDDFSLVDAADQGEKLKLRVRNTTGASITLRYTVRITPLG